MLSFSLGAGPVMYVPPPQSIPATCGRLPDGSFACKAGSPAAATAFRNLWWAMNHVGALRGQAGFVNPGDDLDTDTLYIISQLLGVDLTSNNSNPPAPLVSQLPPTDPVEAAAVNAVIQAALGVDKTSAASFTPSFIKFAQVVVVNAVALTSYLSRAATGAQVPVLMTVGPRALSPQIGPIIDPGPSKYPPGSLARLNTSRSVWSVYAPASGLHGGGLGVADESGACMYGVCGAGLGAGVAPAVPAGYTKVAEEPAAPGSTVSPPGTLPAGTEKDTHWYSTWWGISAMVVGAAALGTGGYYLLRTPKHAAAY